MTETGRRRTSTARTQGERSAATREKLMDATIYCLVKYGYTGTTVTRIADRAGVTRGAQVHHFGSKEELVGAAVVYLANKRRDAAIAHLAKMQFSADPVGDLLDLLWDLHQGPIFTATFELLVAARTDKVLRKQFQAVEPIVTEGIGSYFDTFLGPTVDHTILRHAVLTAMDTMRGLITASWAADEAELNARWLRAKDRLRVMCLASLEEALGGEPTDSPRLTRKLSTRA